MEEARQNQAEAERQQRLAELIQKADKFYDSGDLDSAAACYNQALAFDEENVQALNRIREIAQRLRDQTQTTIDTRAGELAYERLLAKYAVTADSLYEAQELENARLEYSKMLALDSTNQHARQRLMEIEASFERRYQQIVARGIGLIDNKRYAEAIMVLGEAQKIRPQDRRATDLIALAQNRLLAAQKLERALELLDNGDSSSAQAMFEEILSLDPQHEAAQNFLRALEQKEALQPVSISQLKADADIWKIYLEGLELFGQKRYEEAISKWQIVLEKYPGSEDTRENIRQTRLRLQNENQ